jgi:adenine phosphoribosyltransferase
VSAAAAALDLKSFVRDVPDFPKKGIVFKDITPLLADPRALDETVRSLADAARKVGARKVLAIESRGFIFGSAVAQVLGVGFVPVRKKGKLPRETLSVTYDLEYGTDTLEMHRDALAPGEPVVVVDDVLATGGTAESVAKLVAQTGASLKGFGFVIELDFLKGRDRLKSWPVHSLIHY